MALSKKRIEFWRAEMSMLDDLYKSRMKKWQRLIDLYDLKFKDRIRDLRPEDLVRISRFYPIVRQFIASTSFNYPKLFFAIEEEEGNGLATVMERASTVLLEQMDVKPHVHQAIFDALFCSVGWLRVDYNPPGDDMIPPYTTNDAMAEDLTAVSRVPPWNVHLDPQTPPHKLGHGRYIREKLWVPLKSLKDDPNIHNKHQIKPTSVGSNEELGFGETFSSSTDEEEVKALRKSVDNGDMVLVNRIHDRINRRLIMFADGVEDPIQDIEHPFVKMSFPDATDVFGNPIEDENGEPMKDLGNGVSVPGWLVQSGFPFIPVKFDVHATSFYPEPHMAYLEDLQNLIVESMSRRATLLKRTSVQGLVNKQEREENPNVLDGLRKGVDGQYHDVLDHNNFRELTPPDVPSDQLRIQVDATQFEDEISRVNDLDKASGTPRTATESALIGAQISVNREWAQVKVSEVYTTIIRNCFQIMGDPRYVPENFVVNVAPNGKQAMLRSLTNADFLWNYRITVQAGSMEPMFEQIQSQKFLNFYDRAVNRPNFDPVELDRMLAASVDIVDVEKVMISNLNPEATQAAMIENSLLIQGQDPGVVAGQDHRAHMEIHNQLQEDPQISQLQQQAQQIGFNGQPTNPQAQQYLQQIAQVQQQHNAAHEQAMADEQEGVSSGAPPGPSKDLTGVVRGNAQNVSNALEGAAEFTQ